MKTKIPILPAMMAGLALLALPGRGTQISAPARLDALKIIRFLDKIEADSLAKRTAPPGRMDFTESEFNSYISYLIAAEKEPIMKELRLKLFDQNRIEGKIFIDLKGRNIPPVLKPEMSFYFEGIFATEAGRIRLDFRKLYLDGQRIPNLVLDIIIFIAAKLGKADAGSVNDWYELPSGIKDLKTASGLVSVYY